MKSVIIALIGCLFGFAAYTDPVKPSAIKVKMTGMKNDKGYALVGLYNEKDGFPFDVKKAFKGAKAKVLNGNAAVSFKKVPQGTYAIAVLHDEDNNMKMARKVTGLPREEYGFSNDAKATFGPPKFEKASFFHNGEQVISIRMKN